MEIADPGAIQLESDVAVQLAELAESFRSLNQLRDQVGEAADQEPTKRFELIVDAVHESAAIEGLAGTRRETESELEAMVEAHKHGRILSGTEVTNLYSAVRRVGRFLQEGKTPGSETLLELHELLLGKPVGPVYKVPPGHWRQEPNLIRGDSTWHTPPWQDVPRLMAVLDATLMQHIERADPILLATWAHHSLTQVHPFMDGNGRSARLLQDHILWHRRYAPAILPGDRPSVQSYYRALDAADSGDLNPLLRLVASAAHISAQRLTETYRRQVRARRFQFDFRSRVAAATAESAEREYRLWSATMHDIREAFELGADALADIEDLHVRVEFREFPVVDFETWRRLRRTGRTDPNWFFTVKFASKTVLRQFIFSFGRHFVEDADPQAEQAVERVSLKLSVKDQTGRRIDLPRRPEVATPALRELWLLDSGICARVVERDAAGATTLARIERVDIVDVVRDFLIEVLREDFGVHL